MKYSQHQLERRHRLFAAREQQYILQTLAGRLRDDVDAGFEFVIRVDKTHFAAATTKQFQEQSAEVLIDLIERITETFARAPFDFAQRFFSRRNSFGDVFSLRAQEG